MTTAGKVNEEMMGPQRKGWPQLRPFPQPDGAVWSVFKQKLLGEGEGQTLVEALATLVFEATYRVLPYRGAGKKDVPETVLGHAAAAHGGTLDANAQLFELRKQVDALTKKVDELLARGAK